MALSHANDFAGTAQRLHVGLLVELLGAAVGMMSAREMKQPLPGAESRGVTSSKGMAKIPYEHDHRGMATAVEPQRTHMDTDHLIQQLADRAQPVARLLAPWRRTMLWLGASLLYVGIVVAAYLLAGGGLPGFIESRFVLEVAAILATAITAAIAAFSSVVPGRDRRFLMLPLIPLSVWLATLGHSCLQDWRMLGTAGLQVRVDWECAFPALVISTLPAGAMLLMLRRGAPLIPAVSLALGMLAAGAMANFGLRIFHAGDLSIQILIWHGCGAVVVAMIASLVGRRVLNWNDWVKRAA